MSPARGAPTASRSELARIVLVAGTVNAAHGVGRYDYLAGCRLAAFLLEQTADVSATVARDGWPEDETILEDARSVVFYTGGGGEHAFLASPQRVNRLQRLIDQGVGIVAIHQAVRFRRDFARRAASWMGGAHVSDQLGQGHWRSHHTRFPSHAVTRGVLPWKMKGSWFNEIEFVDSMRGITPLVWSSRTYRGSEVGGVADVVAWTYERPRGGRSFCFTGLDAHSAWSVPGVRQLLVNGILWSAGLKIPPGGAPCALDETRATGYLTPRSKPRGMIGDLWRRLRRQAG